MDDKEIGEKGSVWGVDLEKDGGNKLEWQNKEGGGITPRGEERTMMEIIMKRKKNWVEHFLRQKGSLKNAVEGGVGGESF